MNKARLYERVAQALDEAEVTEDADVSEQGLYLTLPDGSEWALTLRRVS